MTKKLLITLSIFALFASAAPPPPPTPMLPPPPQPETRITGSWGINSFDDPRIMDEHDPEAFLLGYYLIHPTKRIVGMLGHTTVTSGDIHGHGTMFVNTGIINFDTTTLFVVGNKIFFKEEIDFFPELDLNSLQILYTDSRLFNRFHFFARDNNHLYIGAVGRFREQYRHNHRVTIINIENYTLINNHIYQKGESLYFLCHRLGFTGTEIGLVRIINPEKFHLPTLEHLTGDIFADKNGVYRLIAQRYEGNRVYAVEKLEQERSSIRIADNSHITNPFVVDAENQVHLGRRDSPIYEPIDAENLRFIKHNGQRTWFMTDGKWLIYTRITGTISVRHGDERLSSISRNIIPMSDVDLPTLRVITPDILMDKNNFYNGSSGINVVPIEALGVNVRIFTE